MSADLAIGVKVGFAAGAAISGLKSLKGSIKSLNDEQQRLSARQRLIGQTLQNPLRMSRQRVNIPNLAQLSIKFVKNNSNFPILIQNLVI